MKLLVFILWVVCASASELSASERDALVALYNAVGGNGWTNNTGWLVGDPCSWHGVTCNVNGSVTQLCAAPKNA